MIASGEERRGGGSEVVKLHILNPKNSPINLNDLVTLATILRDHWQLRFYTTDPSIGPIFLFREAEGGFSTIDLTARKP